MPTTQEARQSGTVAREPVVVPTQRVGTEGDVGRSG